MGNDKDKVMTGFYEMFSKASLDTIMSDPEITENALSILDHLIIQHPEDMHLKKLMGTALTDQGEYEKACPYLKTVMKSFDENNIDTDVENSLAFSLYHLKRYKDAVPYLEASHVTYPQCSDTTIMLGFSLYLSQEDTLRGQQLILENLDHLDMREHTSEIKDMLLLQSPATPTP